MMIDPIVIPNFLELRSNWTSKGNILIVAPKMHVSADELDKTVEIAQKKRIAML